MINRYSNINKIFNFLEFVYESYMNSKKENYVIKRSCL